MKLPIITCSTLLLVSFVGAAAAQTAPASKPPRPGTLAASTNSKAAMAQCEEYYGGQRFFLGRDRYGYIEQCFKSLTGMYPHQAKLNCSLSRC